MEIKSDYNYASLTHATGQEKVQRPDETIVQSLCNKLLNLVRIDKNNRFICPTMHEGSGTVKKEFVYIRSTAFSSLAYITIKGKISQGRQDGWMGALGGAVGRIAAAAILPFGLLFDLSTFIPRALVNIISSVKKASSDKSLTSMGKVGFVARQTLYVFNLPALLLQIIEHAIFPYSNDDFHSLKERKRIGELNIFRRFIISNLVIAENNVKNAKKN